MKRTSLSHSRASALLPALTAVFACILPLILAEVPAWWRDRGVLKTDGTGLPVAASDFAAANQGQLKNFAIAAYEEFLAKIPAELGGIGPIVPPPNASQPESPVNRASPGWRIRQLVSQWVVLDTATGRVLHADLNAQGHPTGMYSVNGKGPRKLALGAGMAGGDAGAPKDFAAINLGQLKAVAAPFYDRLAELYWSYNSADRATSQIDPAWAKPWTDAPGDANDHAMATLGQLKRVFAINLDSDADSDGLTNLAELLANKLRDSSVNSKWTDLANAYSSGSQLTDGEQVGMGLDPTDPANGLPPDAPTGLHITFTDADAHPEDPDLRNFRVEWTAPTETGITVSLSQTYAGNPGGWTTASSGRTMSSQITVPFSKRVYEYRVTFTARNGLTASSDIAYEVPVIRGLMSRQAVTYFRFTGVLLYPGTYSGVPLKYRDFSHTWNYDEKTSKTGDDGKVTTHTVHDDGTYARNFYPSTHSYHVNTVQNESDTWSGPEDDDSGEWTRNRVYTMNLTEPVATFPSSLSSSEFTDILTSTSGHNLDDKVSLSLGFGLHPFQTADGSGSPVLPVPFASFGATDSGHYYSDAADGGDQSHQDWSSTAALDAAADGQFLNWTGSSTISTTTDGTTDTNSDERNYGEMARSIPIVPSLTPRDFDHSGFIGPEDRNEVHWEVPPYGQNPPQGVTPTVTVSEDGLSWTRTYGTAPEGDPAQAPQASYEPYWTETVTFSGEITTASLVDAAIGTLAPMSTIGWTRPGQQPPSRFSNDFSVGSLGLSEHETEVVNSWLDWDYSNSYAPAATKDSLAFAGWPQNGYVTVTPGIAGLVGQYSLSADEDSGTLLKSEYKFRIYPPAESCEIQWLETFDPDHTIIGRVQPRYKIRTCTVTPGQQLPETPVQTVDRTQGWSDQGSSLNAPAAAQPSGTGPQGQVNLSGLDDSAIRFRQRPNKVYFGFDPWMPGDVQPNLQGRNIPPFIVPGSDSALDRKHNSWASVVKTGPGRANESLQVWFVNSEWAKRVKLMVQPGSEGLIDVEPKNVPLEATVDSAPGHSALFKIIAKPPAGVNADRILEAFIELRTADADAKLLRTLRVMVLPEVKVDLAIYRVEDPLGNKHEPFDTKLPNNLPVNEELKERFNQIFRQAGITFVLNPKCDDRIHRIRYDVVPPAGDGKINAIEATSPEIQVLHGASELNQAKLNLIILRGPISNSRTGGWANTDGNGDLIGKQVYMTTYAYEFLPDGRPSDDPAHGFPVFTNSAAHELGHAFGLSTRLDDAHPRGKVYRHDPGIFPGRGSGPANEYAMKLGLMCWTQEDDSRWLRHEDWYWAWTNARRFR